MISLTFNGCLCYNSLVAWNTRAGKEGDHAYEHQLRCNLARFGRYN